MGLGAWFEGVAERTDVRDARKLVRLRVLAQRARLVRVRVRVRVRVSVRVRVRVRVRV